jgi:hypothetical protein
MHFSWVEGANNDTILSRSRCCNLFVCLSACSDTQKFACFLTIRCCKSSESKQQGKENWPTRMPPPGGSRMQSVVLHLWGQMFRNWLQPHSLSLDPVLVPQSPLRPAPFPPRRLINQEIITLLSAFDRRNKPPRLCATTCPGFT